MMHRCLAALTALLVLSACTRVSSVSQGGRNPSTIPHVLRFTDRGEPDHFNPLLSGMDLVYDLDSLVFSFLVVSDDRSHLVGDLATAVPTLQNGGISKDGRTYTYHLRHNVRWHDGLALTSRDVKFTAAAVMNPNNNTLHREGYDYVASIDTPDDYTVVVHLKQRYPSFVTKFFAPLQEGGHAILPEHLLGKLHDINQADFNAHPVGSGPFKFVSWERGRRIVLARNDAYFRGKPKLAKVVFDVIPDDNAELNAVRTHDVDLVVAPPSALYEQYKAVPGYAVYLVPWNAQGMMLINARHAPLNEQPVKHAIVDAIDYDTIIRKVTHGVGTPAHDIVPPGAIGYTLNPPYAYDPAAANALLERAGWKMQPDGVRERAGKRLEFVMHITAGSANSAAIAAVIQANLRAVGIATTIKTYPYTVIFASDGPIYGGRYDFAVESVTQPYDPDNLFLVGCNYWFPKGENLYGYCDRRVDAGEIAGDATDDVAQRERIYHATEKRLHETIPWVPLYNLRRVIVRNTDLKNYRPNATSTPWWNAWEWDI